MQRTLKKKIADKFFAKFSKFDQIFCKNYQFWTNKKCKFRQLIFRVPIY